jgi:protein-disulfide isomerase
MRNLQTFAIVFFTALLTLFSVRSYADVPGTPVMTTPQLYYPALDTVAGNKQGKVTLVEFFDYRCGYCRQVPPLLAQLIKTYPQVRIVYRDYPALGPTSLIAARAALAAAKQGKYLPMHTALISSSQPLSQENIMSMARSLGLDTAKMTRNMDSDAINHQLGVTSAFVQDLGINGVPTFVVAATPKANHAGPVGAYLIMSPGLDDFEKLIAKVSSSNKG